MYIQGKTLQSMLTLWEKRAAWNYQEYIFIILNLNHIDSRYAFLKLSDPQLQKVEKCQQKLGFFLMGNREVSFYCSGTKQ